MKFDEYINSLEGKSDLDPLQIARDLYKIYVDDISTRDAKIDELNGTITERDGAITVAADEIKSWKARNFDLALQIPGHPATGKVEDADDDIDPSLVTIDDLFVT